MNIHVPLPIMIDILPQFPKDLICYCSYKYQEGSVCVGYGVGKVGVRKGLR